MTLRERRLHATEKGVSNAQQSKSLQLILGRGGHGCMSVTLNYCMQMHADLGAGLRKRETLVITVFLACSSAD